MIPVHLLVKKLDPLFVECLPAIHSLTGCDTTSKVGSKTAVFKKDINSNLIKGFGKHSEITLNEIANAETFLLQVLGENETITFDKYRLMQYLDPQKKLSLNSLVCCSATIAEHIKRSHMQTNLWVNSNKLQCSDNQELDPTNFGYTYVLFSVMSPS